MAVNIALRLAKPAIFASSQKLRDVIVDPSANTVFFGSSRVESGVIPDVFDQAMHEFGFVGIHSYNVAQPDKLIVESFADAEVLLDLRPRDIKFVFFEPNLLGRLVDV